MKPYRNLAAGALLGIALAACGKEHPTAPHSPEPPSVDVDWEGLRRLYDDPLYRGLAHLVEDDAVEQSLDEGMSALVLAIRSQNLTGVKQAMDRIHAERVAYAERLGPNRHEEPQLLALSLFEIRGAAYIGHDSLHIRDWQMSIGKGR